MIENREKSKKREFLSLRFVKDSSVVARKIAEELILVPISRRAGDVESIYTANEVAARIWELIDGKNRVDQIRDVIVDEFEVSREKAEADLLEFLQQLKKIGAVRKI